MKKDLKNIITMFVILVSMIALNSCAQNKVNTTTGDQTNPNKVYRKFNYDPVYTLKNNLYVESTGQTGLTVLDDSTIKAGVIYFGIILELTPNITPNYKNAAYYFMESDTILIQTINEDEFIYYSPSIDKQYYVMYWRNDDNLIESVYVTQWEISANASIERLF